MTDQHPSLSDRQLKTAQVLSRLETERTSRYMAIALFWVLTVLFAANSTFLLYAAFSEHGSSITKVVSASFDGLLGILLVIVARHLFPPRCKDKDGVVREIVGSTDS